MKISQIGFYVYVLLILTSGLFFLEGCAKTVQVADPIELSDLDSDKVIIRLMRDSQFTGSAGYFTVKDNGKLIGRIASGGELQWERESGNMKLDFEAMFGGVARSINLDTVAGKVYTFRITIKIGDISIKMVNPNT